MKLHCAWSLSQVSEKNQCFIDRKGHLLFSLTSKLIDTMKRLILNITLLVFMALGSINAMAHDSIVKYGIAISYDGDQIAYGKSGSGDTALIFIHGWSLDSRLWQNQVSEFSKQY